MVTKMQKIEKKPSWPVYVYEPPPGYEPIPFDPEQLVPEGYEPVLIDLTDRLGEGQRSDNQELKDQG